MAGILTSGKLTALGALDALSAATDNVGITAVDLTIGSAESVLAVFSVAPAGLREGVSMMGAVSVGVA